MCNELLATPRDLDRNILLVAGDRYPDSIV